MPTSILVLRLSGTYAAKIAENHTPLHVSLNISVTRGNLSNVNTLLASLATWSKKAPQIFEWWSSNNVIEGNVQEGSNFKA